jgi:GntR family transcriptional regulator/MocR family aminotransferase
MRYPGSGGSATIAILSVALDRTASAPLMRQLYLQIRDLILTRRIAPGARMPSTRKLSRDLQISRTVTLDVFDQLASEGFIESRPGSGHYVQPLSAFPSASAARTTLPKSGPISQPERRPSARPFDPTWSAVNQFPARIWGRMLARGWRMHEAAAGDVSWKGVLVLREALADHLNALRGLSITPDQILVTAGNADALRMIAQWLRRKYSAPPIFWIEDPAFQGSVVTLRREGAQLVPIPVDAEGMLVSHAIAACPDAHAALVTPTRQFPLGMPLSLSRRLELLEWARRSDGIVIEDDYDSEIRFVGRPLQSLSSLDADAPVLSLGSFSKLTFPGLRLGYVAGPAHLIDQLAMIRQELGTLVPTSGQVGFAEFMAGGEFVRHLRNLRAYLTRRRLLMVEFLSRDGGEFVDILPQEVGMHLTVALADRGASDVNLCRRADAIGLSLHPLSRQYHDADGPPGFVLGYSGWSEDEIRAALRSLLTLLRDRDSPVPALDR